MFGFDKPPLDRFLLMLRDYAAFDFGRSFFRDQTVLTLVGQKMPVSISIGLWSTLLVYLVSIPLGIAKAVRDGSRFDVASSVAVLVGYAIPGFLFAILLVVLFAGGSFVSWFPLRGLSSSGAENWGIGARVLDYAWHMVLPTIALVVGGFAGLTMLTKNSFLEEIRKQYVTTARAKGASEARVIYGFRISVLFGFTLTIISSVIGIAAGAVQGFYGGLVDLLFQRFIEIWSGMPQLYMLIILSSIITPGFWILLVFLLLFSWMGLTGVVRAEFLRGRNLEYVRAARALGVSNLTVMWRHILPNAMVATLTFLPFTLSGSVTILASLDFLGFGLPPGSPSLGELVAQGKNNLQAPWLGLTAFIVLGGMLILLIFIGEAVRAAFDPRKSLK